MVLSEIKKMIGFNENYDAFDTDLVIFINSTLSVLNQLGVPVLSYIDSYDTKDWPDILGCNSSIEMIKSYIFMQTKLAFDPPINGSVIATLKEQIKEYEWRINLEVEVPSNSVLPEGGDADD